MKFSEDSYQYKILNDNNSQISGIIESKYSSDPFICKWLMFGQDSFTNLTISGVVLVKDNLTNASLQRELIMSILISSQYHTTNLDKPL